MDSRHPKQLPRLPRRDLLKAGVAAGAIMSAEPGLAPRALRAQPERGGNSPRMRLRSAPLRPPSDAQLQDEHHAELVYNRLVRYKVGPGLPPGVFTVEPDLAERWDEPDETTYVFYLRKGVRWHAKPPVNGRELTAEGIKFTYDRFLTEKGNPLRYTLDPVEAVDRYTPAERGRAAVLRLSLLRRHHRVVAALCEGLPAHPQLRLRQPCRHALARSVDGRARHGPF